MAYKQSFRGSFERDIKKFKKEARIKKAILEASALIVADPTQGKPLQGDWFGTHNFAFYESPEMRIIYAFYQCCPATEEDECYGVDKPADCQGLVEFIFAKTREECNNLYSLEREYVEQFLRNDPK